MKPLPTTMAPLPTTNKYQAARRAGNKWAWVVFIAAGIALYLLW